MRRRNLRKIGTVIACAVIISVFGGSTSVFAQEITGETSLGGASLYLNRYYDKTTEEDSVTYLLAEPVTIPENVAIANVSDYLNIRKEPGISYSVVGYLPRNGVCVVEEVADGWAKIKSGTVTGYVSTDYLYMGEDGYNKANELASLMATVNAGTVNFRSEPNTTTDENILATVSRGEALHVIEELVVSKNDTTILWVKAYLDDMEGYIAKEFVDVAYDWVRAVSMTSIVGADSASGLSSLRASLVIEAKKHIGLRYVWGGNSLSSGADCSGFCLAVYRECGISTKSIPRSSYDIASSSKGRKVSLSQAKPGDLVFYASSTGHVNHVAMYIGNGQIIHESGRKDGCKISNVNYRTVYKIKNFID